MKYQKTTLVEYNGETKQVQEWAKQINIDPKGLASRLNNGYSIKTAIETAPGDQPRMATRTENIRLLMEALNNASNEIVNGERRIDYELRQYVAKNGLIQTYKDLAVFFPKAVFTSLDGSDNEQRKVATVINIGCAVKGASGN